MAEGCRSFNKNLSWNKKQNNWNNCVCVCVCVYINKIRTDATISDQRGPKINGHEGMTLYFPGLYRMQFHIKPRTLEGGLHDTMFVLHWSQLIPMHFLCFQYHTHAFLFFPVITLLISSPTGCICQVHLLGSLLVKAIHCRITPNSLELEPHHQMQFSIISKTISFRKGAGSYTSTGDTVSVV